MAESDICHAGLPSVLVLVLVLGRRDTREGRREAAGRLRCLMDRHRRFGAQQLAMDGTRTPTDGNLVAGGASRPCSPQLN